MAADSARDRFKKIHVRFARPSPRVDYSGALQVKQNGREAQILANGNTEQLLAVLRAEQPEELRCESLSLEEIFVASKVLSTSTQ